MQTYIAILRGINVSGQKIIKMAELREQLSALGFSNLTTYIQSGNVIFKSIKKPNLELENSIQQKIKEAFGFDVPVIVRSIEDWQKVVDAFPFKKGLEPIRLLITFLKSEPENIPYEEIDKLKAKDDEIEIGQKEIYLYVPNGYGKTKLNNTTLERKLNVTATTRNWKTISTLLNMAIEL